MKAVDTNILIYAIDQTDLPKHLRAVELVKGLVASGDPPLLLWQVGCEYLSYLQRQRALGRFTSAEVGQEMNHVLTAYELVVPVSAIYGAALKLTQKHSLSHWDSLLLGACVVTGIDTLYSEDMSHRMTYDAVKVINPFKST
jgi:predicted nucleic acid-binding protein